jgi:PmbA protein
MQHILEQTIGFLKNKNLSHFELSASKSIGTSVSVRKGEIEDSVRYQNQGLEINVVKDGKSGSCSTVDLSKNGLENAINKAISLTQFSSVDEFNTLADKDLMAWDEVDLDLYHPYNLSKDEGFNLAKECEEAALENKQIVNSDGAEASSFSSTNYYANSHNFIAQQQTSSHSINCSVIAGKSDEMQTAYDYDSAIIYKKLKNPSEVGRLAAKNAADKLNPQVIKSGNYPVIFSNKISSSIISHILSALSGRAQYKKSSFLLDSLNTIILPENISIYENPIVKQTVGARFFDGDGVQKKEQNFIENGRVKSYILSQYSANQLGMQTTANAGGVNNIEILTNNYSFNDLLNAHQKVIIVDELMGQGVNLITGDYSRGVSGFMVENGEIIHPVAGITIASNLKDMLKNIQMIADDKDLRKNIKVGSILINQMMIAGN